MNVEEVKGCTRLAQTSPDHPTRFEHLLWPQLGFLILGTYLIVGTFTLLSNSLPVPVYLNELINYVR